MTVNEWRRSACRIMEQAGSADAAYDAKLMLCAVLGIEPTELAFRAGNVLDSAQISALEEMLKRRLDGEPMQYIEGKAYFMGLAFRVNQNVLIPRQDTETLCEAALEAIKGCKNPRVLDMCTGSGALAVSIARYAPGAKVTAADISPAALKVAAENAVDNGVNVEFIESDGFTQLKGRQFDVIVCNPPYLSQEDMDELQDEVKREPALALFGGQDGYDFYRRFACEMQDVLIDGGCALFEVGINQAGNVAGLFDNSVIIKDLCGIDRVVKTVKNNGK